MAVASTPARGGSADLSALAKNSAAAPAAGSQPDKNCGCPRRKVGGIELKYRTFRGPSDVGHSWYEMGNRSVGWYPSAQSSRIGSFINTNGSPNRGQMRDPHHGDPADTTSDLYTRDGDCRTDEEIQNCINNYFYAKAARGDRYSVMSWDVCHSVANAAATHCKVDQKAR